MLKKQWDSLGFRESKMMIKSQSTSTKSQKNSKFQDSMTKTF
ncbi:hypothetical protein D1AOALGA4SA_7885 [Olavius algarvensis Delta 1 endosymbiont]|nr:hypothetical protein D1AOALGA4SA_7885 [Olavius algarvensis Delta 1 endosymbiont]